MHQGKQCAVMCQLEKQRPWRLKKRAGVLSLWAHRDTDDLENKSLTLFTPRCPFGMPLGISGIHRSGLKGREAVAEAAEG